MHAVAATDVRVPHNARRYGVTLLATGDCTVIMSPVSDSLVFPPWQPPPGNALQLGLPTLIVTEELAGESPLMNATGQLIDTFFHALAHTAMFNDTTHAAHIELFRVCFAAPKNRAAEYEKAAHALAAMQEKMSAPGRRGEAAAAAP